MIVFLSASFGVAYAGFGLLVALRTRNVQATQSSFLLFFPLLFLTPNFVPFDRLSPLMETLARINPVSYVIVGLRSLVIDGWDAGEIAVCRAGDHRAGHHPHRPLAADDRHLRPLRELTGADGLGSAAASRRVGPGGPEAAPVRAAPTSKSLLRISSRVSTAATSARIAPIRNIVVEAGDEARPHRVHRGGSGLGRQRASPARRRCPGRRRWRARARRGR